MNKDSHKIESPVDKNPLHPFTTPEGYFEDFKVSIMERIKSEEQLDAPESDGNRMSKFVWAFVAAAAVIAMAVVLNFVSFESATDDLQAKQVELLSEEEFEEFIIDETAEDYWRQILLESEGDDDILGSSVKY